MYVCCRPLKQLISKIIDININLKIPSLCTKCNIFQTTQVYTYAFYIHHDQAVLRFAAVTSSLPSLTRDLMALFVLSSSFSWSCNFSLNEGLSVKHSANSKGSNPIISSISTRCCKLTIFDRPLSLFSYRDDFLFMLKTCACVE